MLCFEGITSSKEKLVSWLEQDTLIRINATNCDTIKEAIPGSEVYQSPLSQQTNKP